MKYSEQMSQYVWLIKTISKAKDISLADINQLWRHTEMSQGIEMNRHTFICMKKEIESSFGIDIECDRKTNHYYISNPRALRDNSIQSWIISTINVSNIIRESMSLQDSIILENIPVEKKHLEIIINAMKLKRCIAFSYKKYSDSQPTERFITPCCIKLFRQRWYVIDYNPQNTSRPFTAYAFDRISNIKLTNETFELPQNFCAENIFKNLFGVFIGEVEPAQRIVIRAYGEEQYYIRDLPLHHSQEVKAKGDDYTDYKYYIRPSKDFIGELLSKGNRIEVLSPDAFRRRICDEHLKAAKRYEK